jgi:hypothetical protein
MDDIARIRQRLLNAEAAGEPSKHERDGPLASNKATSK